MLTCRQLSYPRFRCVAQNFQSGGSDTIALPLDNTGMSSSISIFLKDCWVLFRCTNSVCCFHCDTITIRVALLGSERPTILIKGWLSCVRLPTWYLFLSLVIMLFICVCVYIYIHYIHTYIYIYVK